MNGPFAILKTTTAWLTFRGRLPRWHRLMILALASAAVQGRPQELIGQRPYEMAWVGRTQDTHPALIDFENLAGWRVDTRDSVATLVCSREQQLWGTYVGKLIYRATGPSPSVTLRPPQPLPLPSPSDCINFWIYGNNWAWAPDATTPPVEISVMLRNKRGTEIRVSMGSIHWKEWWVMHRKLTAEQFDLLKDGATLEGIQINNGRNKNDRVIYLDNLAVYQENLQPLVFAPRRQRGVAPFPGQTAGINTGSGKLPFPTREETILPDNLTTDFKTTLERAGDSFVFRYRGSDGQLEYRYSPKTGTLGDIAAQWVGRGAVFQPMAEGGVYFAGPGSEASAPDKIELLGCEQVGDTVASRWRCQSGTTTAEAVYTFRIWQKSLLVDVRCLGGKIGEVRFGKAIGVEHPRLVTLPYLSYGGPRPAVLVGGATNRPLFLFALPDYYRSNASLLWALNDISPDGVFYNGGARYLPKTDGRRNDCFERFFLTVSPRVEEILPNISNPPSPWMAVAGERVWRAHGAENRDADYACWKRVARYGMTKILITDHETGWRDGGESFTFRTRAAPQKGGDATQAEYARKLHALGFRYGIYNNHTDFAPVNEFWDEDLVTRLPNGDWQTAWARCYNPKPARAVEFEARLTPIIQQKFQLDTAYCDVHTAVTPWNYCDFDARVPGAGTFAATFYAYGEIMLHQKATWNGPVYSEGNHHWFYCGLTDGNYGQDQAAKLSVNPWLVDFDLRKLHPLCCNFGMGNPSMFYGKEELHGKTDAERDAQLDRFLAATLAFGHTGFLVMESGMENAVRSYFSLQQIQAHYAQQAVADIRYADAQGQLLETSAAVASGAYRRSQIATRYANGLRVVVNGHPTETWPTADAELPPNGWLVQAPGGDLFAFSAKLNGHRVDYVDTPAYLYVDGRGQFTRFKNAASDGPLIVHKHPGHSLEVIPVGRCASFGVALDGRMATAIALDKEGQELGPATTRLSRGLVYIVPQSNAFSYRLTPASSPVVQLTSVRDQVVPGETVPITGNQSHTFPVPHDTQPGARLWQQFEGAWIDFTVVPVVETKLTLSAKIRLEITSHLPSPTKAEVTLGTTHQAVALVPERPSELFFDPPRPDRAGVRKLPLSFTADDFHFEKTWWVQTVNRIVPLVPLPEQYTIGQQLRKQAQTHLDLASGASVHPDSHLSCGGIEKPGLFMHPPYKSGVGYVCATYEPVTVPREPMATFRCAIGKLDGSARGDGICFQLAVVTQDGRETIAAEKQWIEHAWTSLEADLGRWAGQTIQLKLIADVGPKDDSTGDWSGWAEMRIESGAPVLVTSLHDSPTQAAPDR